MCPSIQELETIALCLPMSTAWPERGFSTLRRVKSKYRNRLTDQTLSALLNVSLNGSKTLSEEAALNISSKWVDRRKRREVTQRALDSLTEELPVSIDEECFIEDFDSDIFLL